MIYTPLHVHSDASSDGAGTVDALVKRAKEIGCEALALTDHGTLANAIAFWSACHDAEIKPIFGLEAYLLYQGRRHHLTLLSLSETGFNNLVELDTWSHSVMHQGGFPLITLEELEKHNQGLYALTGCASSALYHGTDLDGLHFVGELSDAMDKGRVGLELQFLGTHNTWSRPMQYFQSFHHALPLVITNDTHYPCRNQFKAHQAICSARKGYTYDSEHLWLKTSKEIWHEAKKYVDQATVQMGLRNTRWIGEIAEAWDMRRPPSLPSIPDAEMHLKDAIKDALQFDINNYGQREVRIARTRREWKVLKEKGFLDYIYILWDIVMWAKSQEIVVGPGRGSGAGSYILFLLGITGVDPIEHGLFFERFLNPGRADYPDVDVDFEADRRHEVFEYATNRWGTIPIATYSCYSHKSAIHDIARVLHIPKNIEEAAADSTTDSEAFGEFTNYAPDALVTYQTMLGQIRHRGKHAAGVIIPNRPVPIERTGDTLAAAWAEGTNTKDLSKAGFVKYDLLGLTALSQLKRMEELTGVRPPHETDDSEVYDLFCKGDVAGIFQWSGSDGIRELTIRVSPRTFLDLTTCNALYRPGALDAGTAEHYPEFMRSPRKLHPRIDTHLEQTYGVICYQEQVMAVVAEVMGGDLEQADLARRLLAKSDVGNIKWEAEIAGLYASFILRGKGEGFNEPLLEKLWHEIYTHSRYSYNLSHATTYTLISYRMAWYKVHHRPAFTCSVLQYDRANAQSYILDAVSNGMQINMPNVNHSDLNYRLIGNDIYLPLSDVAYLGEKGASFLIQERDRNGPFSSYEDFDKRVPKKTCNNRARVMMERIGAFSTLTGDATSAIKDYTSIPVPQPYLDQLEILKFVVPTPDMLKRIELLRARPTKKGWVRFAGFVREVKKKKSAIGEYWSYLLSPSGSFWVREPKLHLKVGTLVAGSKNKFGHSNDVKAYRLSSS